MIKNHLSIKIAAMENKKCNVHISFKCQNILQGAILKYMNDNCIHNGQCIENIFKHLCIFLNT